MSARKAAFAFKAWAQENHLIGHEFPVNLGVTDAEKDAIFDGLNISAASESCLRSRHINAVGFNEATQEVLVFLSRKPLKKDLKALPETFEEDIKVRYIHGGVAHAGLPTSGLVHSAYVVRDGRYACGGSIHPARYIGSGTIGCLVRDANGDIYGLTNNHVSGLCNYSLVGEKILAPGHLDIEANGLDPFTIGHHSRSLPMVAGVPDNVNVSENWDAALIKIANTDYVTSHQGTIYDTPNVVAPIQANQAVQKIGRTTGHTNGLVLGMLAGPFPVTYTVPTVGNQIAYFDQVYVVQGSPSTDPFSQPGDSGSLVTAMIGNQLTAVGLVFAGDSQGRSYICSAKVVMSPLSKVEMSPSRIWSGHGKGNHCDEQKGA